MRTYSFCEDNVLFRRTILAVVRCRTKLGVKMIALSGYETSCLPKTRVKAAQRRKDVESDGEDDQETHGNDDGYTGEKADMLEIGQDG